MGQFSWIYSDTNRAMLDGVYRNSFLLVPEAFSKEYGPYIKEECYDGYGVFGKHHDVYELVAIWNREYVSQNPDHVTYRGRKYSEFSWYPYFSDMSLSIQEALRRWQEAKSNGNKDFRCWELRHIGIDIGCYDEDNRALPYPIKIVEHPIAYELAYPSDMDPNQGWGE